MTVPFMNLQNNEPWCHDAQSRYLYVSVLLVYVFISSTLVSLNLK